MPLKYTNVKTPSEVSGRFTGVFLFEWYKYIACLQTLYILKQQLFDCLVNINVTAVLALKTIKYFYKIMETEGVFSIWSNHKCLS